MKVVECSENFLSKSISPTDSLPNVVFRTPTCWYLQKNLIFYVIDGGYGIPRVPRVPLTINQGLCFVSALSCCALCSLTWLLLFFLS